MLSALRPLHCLPARPTLLALCLAVSLAAEAAPVPFDLPAQPLARSLSQLAQQAKVQLLFDEGLLGAAQAPALKGDFEAEAAISRLLIGSRFNVVRMGNTYVVRLREDDPIGQQKLSRKPAMERPETRQ